MAVGEGEVVVVEVVSQGVGAARARLLMVARRAMMVLQCIVSSVCGGLVSWIFWLW